MHNHAPRRGKQRGKAYGRFKQAPAISGSYTPFTTHRYRKRDEATKRTECTVRPVRGCATPGCTLLDFHDSPHSFEVLGDKKRVAMRFCPLVGFANNEAKRQKKTPLPAVRDGAALQQKESSTDKAEDVEMTVAAEDVSSEMSGLLLQKDAYDSTVKNTTRSSFAAYCLEASKSTDRKDILYLESPHGGATKELLKHFDAKNLHPCNKSADAVESLKTLFPEVCVVKGDIYKIHNTREWLGVWFDTVSSGFQTHGLATTDFTFRTHR